MPTRAATKALVTITRTADNARSRRPARSRSPRAMCSRRTPMTIAPTQGQTLQRDGGDLHRHQHDQRAERLHGDHQLGRRDDDGRHGVAAVRRHVHGLRLAHLCGGGDRHVTVTLTDDAPGTATATAISTANVGAAAAGQVGADVGDRACGAGGNTTVATFTDTNTATLASGSPRRSTGATARRRRARSAASNGSFTVSGGHTYADEGSDPRSVTITAPRTTRRHGDGNGHGRRARRADGARRRRSTRNPGADQRDGGDFHRHRHGDGRATSRRPSTGATGRRRPAR